MSAPAPTPIEPPFPPDTSEQIQARLSQIERDAKRVASMASRVAEIYTNLETRLRALPGNTRVVAESLPSPELAIAWGKQPSGDWRIHLSEEVSGVDHEGEPEWKWLEWNKCPISLQARCLPLIVPLLDQLAARHRERLSALETVTPFFDGLEDA